MIGTGNCYQPPNSLLLVPDRIPNDSEKHYLKMFVLNSHLPKELEHDMFYAILSHVKFNQVNFYTFVKTVGKHPRIKSLNVIVLLSGGKRELTSYKINDLCNR